MSGFAEPADYLFCRDLHRRHGTTYFFSSRRLPRAQQRQVDALYGFVRVPDEWVDNPAGQDPAAHIADFRSQLEEGLAGRRPSHPALRAFLDTLHETGIPPEEPRCFLDAMAMDLWKTRYATYQELEAYMRGSAAAVGLMMCRIVGAPNTEEVNRAACCLGNAMQLTNFIRDVGEDLERGRIYMPQEDWERFGVSEADFLERRLTTQVKELLAFQIARARSLYGEADSGIPQIPGPSRKGVLLARILYAMILDRVEERGLDVFSGRARTTRAEKLAVAARVLATGR